MIRSGDLSAKKRLGGFWTATTAAVRGSVLSALILVMVGGCRTYQQAPYPGDEAAGIQSDPQSDIVVPGDTLKVEFLYHEQWNAEMVVRPDGTMSMPLLGQVKVSGRTIKALRSEFERRLEDEHQIDQPVIRLDLVAAARLIYVAGEVATPGVVAFTGSTVTLLEALVLAGGPVKESADLRFVIIVREDSAGVRRSWKFNMEPILSAATPPQPIRLRNRDVVIVPNSPIDQVNLFVKNYIGDMFPLGATTVGLFATQ